MSNQLTNHELENIIKDFKLDYCFGGVFSKDQLPQLKRDTFYIVNLQDSDDGGGTHWTAFYYNKLLESFYWDSYGFIAPTDVEEKITPYEFNNSEIQDMDSSACGYFCVAFIKILHNKVNKKEAYKAFLSLFKHHPAKNDKILHNLLYS
jgi:hypothetical protein